EAGNSIADMLYSTYNPSGKLLYTISKDPTDYPTQLRLPLLIDFMFFAVNITPHFEFGFGLSYTMFSCSDLCVTPIQSLDVDQADLITAWENGEVSPIAEGSSTALWLREPTFHITFEVTNTGPMSGTE
ncbi:uncharacterized protein EDB91DRAFT_1005033, partial [Suillus paluster]|uniref:uncharacterized protein n=1 Tax=Suillus paluster TaxID=48578 RepID=UPI001B8616CF